MTDREFRKRLHLAVDGRFSCLKDDPYLAGKVLKNNEKGERFMKKKLAFTPLVVLITVLCCAALAAGGFGLRDFLPRYRSVDLPENWETYVQTPVLTMETEDVTLTVSELLYDGKCLRLMAECTPKKAGVMLIGEDAEPYDRMGADDERTVCEVYAQGGFTAMRRANLYIMGDDETEMDYILHADGSMTVFHSCIYNERTAERDSELSLVDRAVLNPGVDERDSFYELDRQEIQTVTAELHAVSNCPVSVLVCEEPEDYETCGIRIERVRMECSPLEIYYTVTCRVTDEKAYAARGKECFFEFVDPDGDGTDTLREGLSSTGYQTFPDEDGCFTACGSLAYSEVRDAYTVRLYNPFDNGVRYESNCFTVKNAE